MRHADSLKSVGLTTIKQLPQSVLYRSLHRSNLYSFSWNQIYDVPLRTCVGAGALGGQLKTNRFTLFLLSDQFIFFVLSHFKGFHIAEPGEMEQLAM